jgi:sugar/nucleoside kinase (ribokinase family)
MIDALIGQDSEHTIVSIMGRVGNGSFEEFQTAVLAGEGVRVRSLRSDAGDLVYAVEILSDNAGWVTLTRPTARSLGFDPNVFGPHEQQIWDRQLRQALGLPEPGSDEE